VKRRDLLYWIWASLAMGVGRHGFDSLINDYGTPYNIFCEKALDSTRLHGVSRSAIAALSKKDLDEASRILDICERKGISLLTYLDDAYPDMLRGIGDAPVLLYYKGHLPDMNRKMCVATVGMRAMSEYGMHSAYKIAYGMAKSNAVVVSGMAEGIDGVCSAAAIAAGGETVVFLGSGVDVVYPKRHKALYEEICLHGAVMSEYPPGTRPLRYHFPVRNRLISGISQATLVIEASERSGALITAKRAMEQGRRVYALSSPDMQEGSVGTRILLEGGARPLTGAMGVLADHAHIYPKTVRTDFVSRKEEVVTDLSYLAHLGVIDPGAWEFTDSADVGVGHQAAPVQAAAKPPKGSLHKEAQPSKPPLTEDEFSAMSPVEAAIMRCFSTADTVHSELFYELPFAANEVSVALTCLEIAGRIRKTLGSLYERS